MAKYRVYLHATVGATVLVEADSLDEARELAFDELPGGLCFQCAGGKMGFKSYSLDLGDFDLDVEEEYNGTVYPNAELVED